MYVCMYVCMYVWMDGWMDGWMNICMDECMDVCMCLNGQEPCILKIELFNFLITMNIRFLTNFGLF